jgi:hypothetical protein
MLRVATVLALACAACGRLGFAAEGAGPDAATDGAPADVAPVARTCAPGETQGVVTSAFDALPVWGTLANTAPSRLEIANGALRGTVGQAAGSKYASLSGPVADHRRHRLSVQVPEMFDTAGCAQANIALIDASAENYLELLQLCGTLEARLWVGAASTELADIPYDPVAHRWWQLRQDGPRVYYEVSADGVTWSSIADVEAPAYLATAYFQLAVGTDQLETVPSGETVFDDLLDCIR